MAKLCLAGMVGVIVEAAYRYEGEELELGLVHASEGAEYEVLESISGVQVSSRAPRSPGPPPGRGCRLRRGVGLMSALTLPTTLTEQTACSTCTGSGYVSMRRCPDCRGSGIGLASCRQCGDLTADACAICAEPACTQDQIRGDCLRCAGVR